MQKRFRMRVEQVHADATVEHFRVWGGSRSILLRSNRPVFIHHGLKHRRPAWKVLEGKITYKSALELIIKGIEAKAYGY